eukprot:gnl/MRDRNA2_/MRDRNA2_319419_c0_seq1.p1 gnl/MRDRNA2_/MRDRNA2_319419_c0~~gnl/MRDRNA2_/MRDRNA2_319419_c0_seq1.p1  ORF type:complete len:119 (-),score=4.79 gnl/MRDRNA2_/MRDRNA2_319419_c0_seq1:129-485(-)
MTSVKTASLQSKLRSSSAGTRLSGSILSRAEMSSLKYASRLSSSSKVRLSRISRLMKLETHSKAISALTNTFALVGGPSYTKQRKSMTKRKLEGGRYGRAISASSHVELLSSEGALTL